MNVSEMHFPGFGGTWWKCNSWLNDSRVYTSCDNLRANYWHVHGTGAGIPWEMNPFEYQLHSRNYVGTLTCIIPSAIIKSTFVGVLHSAFQKISN